MATPVAKRTIAAHMDPLVGGRIVVRLRARWDDCDSYGHVNNAMYLTLARAATDEGLAALGAPAALAGARLAEATLSYREPVRVGQAIDVRLEVMSAERNALELTYDFTVDGRSRVQATARWVRGEVRREAALPTPEHDAGGVPFVMNHRVRSYELDASTEARPTAILQWLEYAVFRAAERVGWTRARMQDADFVTLQVKHRLSLGVPVVEGDELRITSRLVALRRVSGIWRHEVRRADGEVAALDDSRGAFLDLAGSVRPGPPEMLAALLEGPRAMEDDGW